MTVCAYCCIVVIYCSKKNNVVQNSEGLMNSSYHCQNQDKGGLG